MQSTNTVLMVSPRDFGFDDQTAKTNSFQHNCALSPADIVRRSSREFDGLVEGLRAVGVFVQVYHDADPRAKPSAVFPNNWLSMWPSGTVYLYPMATKSRRLERLPKVLQELADAFEVTKTIDLSGSERHGAYLESTGVMVFDHLQKVVYGGVSERCNEQLFVDHAKALGYDPVVFHAYDAKGTPIYHTNVMMGLQTETAVICAESILSKEERLMVRARIQASGREVIEITQVQMAAFCGNVLELQNNQNERFIAMSQTAYDYFTVDQREALARTTTLLPFAIPTIEAVGGGSVRCMLGEIFLSPKVGDQGQY